MCEGVKEYIKNNIIFFDDNLYYLTDKGNIVLQDNKYYNSVIIYNFLKKCISKKRLFRKFQLKEIRTEQCKLRDYLISNYQNICILCDKKLPLNLLETAHLKPRYILTLPEINDNNIVALMCRYCHKLYDDGMLGVRAGILHLATELTNYDLEYPILKKVKFFNPNNEKYFKYHFEKIFGRKNNLQKLCI